MWNQLEVQGEEGAGCSLVGVKGSHHLHPDSRKEKRWKGQKKKKKRVVGKWCHWGEGSPRHPSPQMLSSSSMTGAGPRGEPWESQGEASVNWCWMGDATGRGCWER